MYSSSGQQHMASSIAKSVQDYYKRQKLNVAVQNYDKDDEVNSSSSVGSVIDASSELGVVYKIQLASSKNRINTASYNFKGIKNVERVKIGDYYKYYLGEYKSKEAAKSGLDLAISKGYKTAFAVGFDNGKHVLEEVTVKKEINSGVFYKIQIASSSKKIKTTASNFKGLEDVEAVKVGRYYKYYLGNTNSYEKAKAYLASAKSKKYRSAYIVAFLKNKRISLKEALKRQTN